MLAARMPSAVKGVGYRSVGGVKPLADDDPQVFTRSEQATRALRQSVKRAYSDPAAVRKSMSPEFMSQFGLFLQQNSGMAQLQEAFSAITTALTELGKNVTLTSPLSLGFVPFDLLAPSRLIYP